MGTILFELALTCYFAVTIIGVIELFKGSRDLSVLMMYLTGAGFVVHTASIMYRYAVGGHLPIASMHDAASFFAWCVVLIFFFLEFRYKIGIMGSFILPMAFILMLSSSALPREIRPLAPALQSYWLGIHTFLAFLGNAAFAVAFGTGALYLIQERNLKSKHTHGLFRKLPSIQVLDEINYKLISIGFPLLTMAIITGAVWAESAWGRYWRWDPKEVWSLITWLIYALILHIRLTAGWRGKRAAVLSIIGFLIVLFTFFGVNLLLKSVHTF
ncbi:MAG: c-type cytochrome biogenesis protein CcsB [Nitrospirae bacterium]|nr:c-type cytochrome biogenesis protein CcsB [Nitrospirota bacterium]